MEDDVHGETDTEDDLAAKQLRARAPEKRTDDIAAEENGGREIADLGADAEFFRDVGSCTAWG